MDLSKCVSRPVQFEFVSGSDISVSNQPKGHLQNYWWFADEIYHMFNNLLPLWFYRRVLFLSEE